MITRTNGRTKGGRRYGLTLSCLRFANVISAEATNIWKQFISTYLHTVKYGTTLKFCLKFYVVSVDSVTYLITMTLLKRSG
jgi:hypothetical protein